jgi:hypothetical protein
MQGYQAANRIQLSSHDFGRVGFTRAAERNVHPKRAAVAFDVTPETMMKTLRGDRKEADARFARS